MATATHKAASHLPRLVVFAGLRSFRRAHLPREVINGITLAALTIPLNIGYAEIAGLPPTAGLYAAILPVIVFALFCSSRHIIASPDAAVAAMIAAFVTPFAAMGTPQYIELVYAQTLLCALIFALFWIFRLGFLVNFLSRAVVVGFIAGLGVEILTSQIKKIMNVSTTADGWLREVIEIITKIPQANLYSVLVGGGTILLILLLKRYTPRLPGALIALVLATIVVAVFSLDQQGVKVLGSVPSGLPSLTIPQVSLGEYLELLPGAVAICLVSLPDTLVLGRRYGKQFNYRFDGDQEMFALGMANAAAGLTGGFATGCSASRTVAMVTGGARSQAPSLISAVVVMISLLFLTGVLALLPSAALAGIVASAVVGLVDIPELRALFRLRLSEGLIGLASLFGVLILGPLIGVMFAFFLSTIEVVRRAARPSSGVLARIPGKASLHLRDVAAAEASEDATSGREQDARSETLPGLVVYRFSTPLYFANANVFREEVDRLTAPAGPQVRWFVLDAQGISDIDTTGEQALEESLTLLKARGITFALSRLTASAQAMLAHYQLLERIGATRIYETNAAALDAYSVETAVEGTAPSPTTTTNGGIGDVDHAAAGAVVDVE
jgi:sulfate permease, SulP family